MTKQLQLSVKGSVANLVFSHYSAFLDRLNWTARWSGTARNKSGCPKFSSREEMYTHLNHAFFDDGKRPLDYFEFGVYRGESYYESACGHERADARQTVQC
jgi:hypothetical protein